MNNYSLEPKDGDFVALVKQLEKKNITAMKNDIVKSNANHQAHIQKDAINELSKVSSSNSSTEDIYSSEDSFADDVVIPVKKARPHVSSNVGNFSTVASAPKDARNNAYRTQRNNLSKSSKAKVTTNQSAYQNAASGNSVSGNSVSSSSVNQNTNKAPKKTSPFVSFLIVACVFVFFSFIVVSDNPERLIRLFVPIFFALIFFNIFKKKPKKK